MTMTCETARDFLPELARGALDGAVANTYAVAVCPTITFAAEGGVVKATTLGSAGEAEIARDIALIR